MSIAKKLRDWWRGYTDADILSIAVKMGPHNPEWRRTDGLICLSEAELKAHMAYFKDIRIHNTIERNRASQDLLAVLHHDAGAA